jgi:hypothetical protein
MRREWEPEDLVACWTLVEHDERELVAYTNGSWSPTSVARRSSGSR